MLFRFSSVESFISKSKATGEGTSKISFRFFLPLLDSLQLELTNSKHGNNYLLKNRRKKIEKLMSKASSDEKYE